MEKKTKLAPPPPYETLTGSSDNTKKDAKSYNTFLIPPQAMETVLAIGTHAERVRLIKEYTVRKATVIETREAALAQQDRALEEAIERVKSDIKGIDQTATDALWNIARKKKHCKRSFIAALFKYTDLKLEIAAYKKLTTAGEDEARLAYQQEVQRIEAEFRDAAKQLDEKFMAKVESVLAKMEGSEASE